MKANVGMQYPVAALITAYTPGTTPTYGTGFKVSEARGANISWDRGGGEFYGDDVLLDTDDGVRSGSIEFETAGIRDAIRADMLGETVASTDEYTLTDAEAPFVGFGFIRVMRDNATTDGSVEERYEAWWLWRVKFSLESEETRTKEGGGIEWRVPTLNGRITGVKQTAEATLDFKTHKTFTSFSAAKSWLDAKANITSSAVTE